MTRALCTLIASIALVTAAQASVVWQANDDRPIPEPAYDDGGEYLWWNAAHKMIFYQFGKVLDLGDSLHSVGRVTGLADPREATNVNALGGVPDSTWFTNRHHLDRLSPAELARGPKQGPPPSPEGSLTVLSGKRNGATPGFVIQDVNGQRFVVKFDPPEAPELATGTEMVVSRIFHALGWNVPGYHLIRLDAERLELAPDATTKDRYNRDRPMTEEDLEEILARAARRPDGRYRAVASAFIPGIPKGPFQPEGVRPDDPNDVIPHEDRRELRGLRVVASWVNYTDAVPRNFYDTFIHRPSDPPGHGYLEHYILDFSNALGSGNVQWKDPRLGHEYFVDPLIIFKSLLSLGLWVKPWEDPILEHPALGYINAETFEPRQWRTEFPLPFFDAMTERDARWGARLVRSFTDEDLRVVVGTANYSDPKAEDRLFEILRERRDRIVEAWLGSLELPHDTHVARVVRERGVTSAARR